MRSPRSLLLVVMLLLSGSCKKDGEGAPDAAVAAPTEPKPATVTRYVGTWTMLQKEVDGGFVPNGTDLELLAALDVALAADGGTHARVYDGAKLLGWVEVAGLLEAKPSRDESMKAAVTALAAGESDVAEHHAWLAWAANRKDFSPLFLASAIEVAHDQELPSRLEQALKGVEKPKAPPRFEALWPDAGEPAVGNTVYVAAGDLALRVKAEAKAAGTPLAVNAALDVVQANGDWLEVTMHAEPVDAGVAVADADAGSPDDDGGTAAAPAAPPAPARGWVEKAGVAVAPLSKEGLVAMGSPRALELAALLDPADGALLVRAIEADLAANRFAGAVALSEQKPDTGYLKSVFLEFAFGCRGNKHKAEGILDAAQLPAKVPPNACIGSLVFPKCVECWQRMSAVNQATRIERETGRRDKLRKRFPDGPFVKTELPPGAPSSQRGFFFEVPYEYQQMRCDEYELVADPDKATVSEPVKLPAAGHDPRVEWYEVKSDTAIYGFVTARSAEEVRRYLRGYAIRKGQGLEKLAPDPNVSADFDSCGDCSSCGD